jgi:hypothetical protein
MSGATEGSTPLFRLGQQVRVAEDLVRRPRVAGRVGKIGRPPYPISWPSYFRTEKTAAGVRRVYWVEFEPRPAVPGAIEGAEVAEVDLRPP